MQIESLEHEIKPLVSDNDGRFSTTSSTLGNLKVAFRYVLAETAKDKKNFIVGVITVFIVVFSISLLENTIENSPVLFLKLAEDNIGEVDLILTPNFRVNKYFLNQSEIDNALQRESLVVGTTPRWVLLTKIINANKINRNASTILLIIDSAREKEIGLGRQWSHPPLNHNQTHVSRSLLRQIGVRPNNNEEVLLRFDLISILHTLAASKQTEVDFVNSILQNFLNIAMGLSTENGNNAFIPNFNVSLFGFNLTSEIILFLLGIQPQNIRNGSFALTYDEVQMLKMRWSLNLRLTVIDEIPEPKGKFAKALGNIAIVERDYINAVIKQLITDAVEQIKSGNITRLLGTTNITDTEQMLIVATLLPFLQSNLKPIEEFRDRFELQSYSLMVIAMYRDRLRTYFKDENGINLDMINFTNRVAVRLGLEYPAVFETPLVDVLVIAYYLRLFLDQILMVVEIFLVAIGAFLIYSLLISDVEAKVYECGMLRALGMEQYTLVALLTIQSLLFSIPAIILGLIVSWLVFIPVGNALSNISAVHIELVLTSRAIVMATIVGFVMPLFALIGPIKRALSKTLRDALDLYHSSVNDTFVTITRLENLGLSPLQTNCALLMVGFGFVIYYLIPYSFIFELWALFFDIFVYILLGMLFGLCLLTVTLHSYIQRIAVHLIMWGRDRYTLKNLVIKNLWGHSRRNSKTAILFTSAIAFLIFAGSFFMLQGGVLVDNVKVGLGADINIQSFYTDMALDEENLRNYLESEKIKPNSDILGWTFFTFYLDDLHYIAGTKVSNLASYPMNYVRLYAVEENYLEFTFDKYLVVQELDRSLEYRRTALGRPDVVKSLYIDQRKSKFFGKEVSVPPLLGTAQKPRDEQHIIELSNNETYTEYIDMLISESLRLPMSVSVETPMLLSIDTISRKDGRHTELSSFFYLAKPRAMLSKMPGFLFSSYPQTVFRSPVIISMDNYYRLMKIAYNNSFVKGKEEFPYKPPKRALLVKLRDGTSMDERERIVNGLRNFLQSDQILVSDTENVARSTDTAINILNLFFNLVALTVITICFFVLLVSFTSNINENSWEFGVLRAIGLNAWQVIRVYIYEAMAVIVASVFLGLLCGLLVAVTLTLQLNLFSEMAFEMKFPGLIFGSIVVMSSVVAVFASYLPAKQLSKKKIAQALKNK
jgi:ABC-type antimicrobial peptide transport system permease subunit